MEIEQNKITDAFNAAKGNEQLTKVLVALFGEQESTSITERIKTFEDAVSELSEFHVYVRAYEDFMYHVFDETYDKDIAAFLKLRIIVAALNEGWKPQFVKNERRWVPWFDFYTNEELERMDETEKVDICRVVGLSNDSADAGSGFVCANAHFASTSASANYGSRIVFKSSELAEYAGSQFIDIYAAEMGIELTGNEREQ